MVFISFQAYGEIPYGWIVSFDILCVYTRYIIYCLNVCMWVCIIPKICVISLSLCMIVSVLFILKVDRILMKCISRPQQLSTYALTLYKYTTTINGKTILVGKFGSYLSVILVYKNWAICCIFFFFSFIIETLHIFAHNWPVWGSFIHLS